MSESPGPMIEVSLLLPRRIWDAIVRYAQEAAQQAQAQHQHPDAVLLLSDPARMAALMLEQAVENEDQLRAMKRAEN
jgi:hypothetical protein